MHISTHLFGRQGRVKARIGLGAVLAAAAALAAVAAAPATGYSGGTSSTSGGSGGSGSCGKARLVHGKARPPDCAPRRVKKVIRAGNQIARGTGYCWGGGHSSFRSSCYDCSGSVSYALHGGHFVKSPMPSSGYYRWGKRGKGGWFTVYTNSGHMFLVVAGLRFDTSMTRGKGPGWSKRVHQERLRDFKKRKKPRF